MWSSLKGASSVYLLLAVALAGCGQLPLSGTTCSSPDATIVAEKLISDQVEKSAIDSAKKDDGTYAISPPAIRASVALLKMDIEDIRTTKSDPNSSKKFCTGTMKVVFPLNAIDDADKGRALANLNTVGALAEASGVQRNADSFTFSIDYDVQPTDDGKSVFAESDSIGPQTNFLAQLVESDLMKPLLEGAAAAQQQAQQQQAQADLSQAQADNKLSVEAINAAWASVTPDVKGQIVDAERAWIAAKTANCNVQAAGASTDPTSREATRLKCDTAANQGRLDWLKQYMPPPPPDAQPNPTG